MRKRIRAVISHPVVSGSAVLVAGSMAVNVINLIYQVVMAKLLQPENYGVLSSLYSILYILSIVPLSSSVAIVKFIASSKNKKERSGVYKEINKLIFYIALFGSGFIILLSPLIAKFLNINDVVYVILTGGVLFFSLITLVNQASLQGILKFTGVVVPNFVSSVIKLVLGIILIYLGLSVGGVMLAVVVGVAVAYFLSVKMANGYFDEKSKIKFDINKFLKYSGPVLIQAFAFTSFFTADVILVKHFFPPYEAGLYAAISTLGKIVFFGASPVASAMFPHISGRHARGEKYEEVLIGSIAITLFISGGVLVVYWIFPHLIIQILYGGKYLAAVPLLVWMGLFITFYTVANLLVNFFLSVDRTKVVIIPFIIAVLQILAIWFKHGSLLEVIQISLFLMVILFTILAGYLGYNRLAYRHEEK